VRICRSGGEEIHSSRRVPLSQEGGKQLHGCCCCCRVTRCFRRRTCETRRIRNSCTKQVRNTHAIVLLYSHFHTIYFIFLSILIENYSYHFTDKISGQLEFLSNCKTRFFLYLLIFPLTIPLFALRKRREI